MGEADREKTVPRSIQIYLVKDVCQRQAMSSLFAENADYFGVPKG
jgi:hypothetical protein